MDIDFLLIGFVIHVPVVYATFLGFKSRQFWNLIFIFILISIFILFIYIMSKVFVVLSVHPDYYERVKSIALEYIQSLTLRKCIVVEEYGKKGTHPHLNLVYTSNCKNHVSLYKQWKGILGEDIVKNNSRCVKVKRVYDLDTLISGYLQKESNAKVLYRKGSVGASSKDEIEAQKAWKLHHKMYGMTICPRDDSLESIASFVNCLYLTCKANELL